MRFAISADDRDAAESGWYIRRGDLGVCLTLSLDSVCDSVPFEHGERALRPRRVRCVECAVAWKRCVCRHVASRVRSPASRHSPAGSNLTS
eukprot:6852897-Prymnesium_polylepis.1